MSTFCQPTKVEIVAVEVFVSTTEDVTCVNFARRIESTRGSRTTTKPVGTSTKKKGPAKNQGDDLQAEMFEMEGCLQCFFLFFLEGG